ADIAHVRVDGDGAVLLSQLDVTAYVVPVVVRVENRDELECLPLERSDDGRRFRGIDDQRFARAIADDDVRVVVGEARDDEDAHPSTIGSSGQAQSSIAFSNVDKSSA